MLKEKSKVTVNDVNTNQTLFECSLEDVEKAYQFAAQMEELGVDVKVISPTLTQTLTRSLGLSEEQTSDYEKSMDEELEHHEGSCCFEDEEDKTIH